MNGLRKWFFVGYSPERINLKDDENTLERTEEDRIRYG